MALEGEQDREKTLREVHSIAIQWIAHVIRLDPLAVDAILKGLIGGLGPCTTFALIAENGFAEPVLITDGEFALHALYNEVRSSQ